jgi:hypothetical protein
MNCEAGSLSSVGCSLCFKNSTFHFSSNAEEMWGKERKKKETGRKIKN